jgi:hypothetical protein
MPSSHRRCADWTIGRPEGLGRHETARHPDGARPLHPASGDAVLQADWDGTFSEASFGFRPGRSAHQAVERAQAYIAAGHGIVVAIDLDKFFDRVNHDILMGLVAKRLLTSAV